MTTDDLGHESYAAPEDMEELHNHLLLKSTDPPPYLGVIIDIAPTSTMPVGALIEDFKKRMKAFHDGRAKKSANFGDGSVKGLNIQDIPSPLALPFAGLRIYRDEQVGLLLRDPSDSTPTPRPLKYNYRVNALLQSTPEFANLRASLLTDPDFVEHIEMTLWTGQEEDGANKVNKEVELRDGVINGDEAIFAARTSFYFSRVSFVEESESENWDELAF
ncbi:hypothetical protein P7C70_g7109, partial [Phenoliferia sp. Uapishka_3]